MKEQNTNTIFAKGNPLPKEYFTGNALLTPLVAKDNNKDYAIGSVAFEPGARTNWHTHPKGQNLLVTEGNGFYQEKGKAARPLKRGDVVIIPENVEHWHGAAPDSHFTHIAITNFKGDSNVIWLEPLTEIEYDAATK
jgi:quercetin dioxygenase-like cupin family protein